jgi:hypothetical protein
MDFVDDQMVINPLTGKWILLLIKWLLIPYRAVG